VPRLLFEGADRDRDFNDPVAAPKVAIEFAKTNERSYLGASDGETVLNAMA